MEVKRTEVWMVQLNPTLGSEIKKSRPCVIISPDEVNRYLQTVTIAPLTSTIKTYPTRVNCTFNRKKGQVAIDQIRSIDKERLKKKLGILDKHAIAAIFSCIQEYFKY